MPKKKDKKEDKMEREQQRLYFEKKKEYGHVLRSNAQKSNIKPDLLNREPRLPAIILLDTSMTMSRYEDTLKKSVKQLYQDLMDDGQAKHSVELGIYTFNRQIDMLQEIQEVCTQEPDWDSFFFRFGKGTLTGHAVQHCVRHLMGRRNKDKNSGLSTYAPILFILSDGNPQFPDDHFMDGEAIAETNNAIRLVQEMVNNNSLVVVSLQIGRSQQVSYYMTRLTGLAPNNPLLKIRYRMIDKDADQIAAIFKWVSNFIISSSHGLEVGEDNQ